MQPCKNYNNLKPSEVTGFVKAVYVTLSSESDRESETELGSEFGYDSDADSVGACDTDPEGQSEVE